MMQLVKMTETKLMKVAYSKNDDVIGLYEYNCKQVT